MPLYTYYCPVHGRFDVIQGMGATSAQCPSCRRDGRKVLTAPARITVNHRGNLPYGNGSPGRYVSSRETGGLPVFIPSYGAMEQQEVDYVAEAAIEKEKVRQKRERDRIVKQKVAAYASLAYRSKPGHRAKTLKDAMLEHGDLKI